MGPTQSRATSGRAEGWILGYLARIPVKIGIAVLTATSVYQLIELRAPAIGEGFPLVPPTVDLFLWASLLIVPILAFRGFYHRYEEISERLENLEAAFEAGEPAVSADLDLRQWAEPRTADKSAYTLGARISRKPDLPAPAALEITCSWFSDSRSATLAQGTWPAIGARESRRDLFTERLGPNSFLVNLSEVDWPEGYVVIVYLYSSQGIIIRRVRSRPRSVPPSTTAPASPPPSSPESSE